MAAAIQFKFPDIGSEDPIDQELLPGNGASGVNHRW
jgi:hypothetical protein